MSQTALGVMSVSCLLVSVGEIDVALCPNDRLEFLLYLARLTKERTNYRDIRCWVRGDLL